MAVPHQTQAIWAAFTHITDRAALRQGDLLLYTSTSIAGGIHHVGIYLGGGARVEAPQSGELVRTGTEIWDGLRGAEFIGGVRPT